jgi:hypothetical protein
MPAAFTERVVGVRRPQSAARLVRTISFLGVSEGRPCPDGLFSVFQLPGLVSESYVHLGQSVACEGRHDTDVVSPVNTILRQEVDPLGCVRARRVTENLTHLGSGCMTGQVRDTGEQVLLFGGGRNNPLGDGDRMARPMLLRSRADCDRECHAGEYDRSFHVAGGR